MLEDVLMPYEFLSAALAGSHTQGQGQHILCISLTPSSYAQHMLCNICLAAVHKLNPILLQPSSPASAGTMWSGP
jgi:hypothetical protein